MSDDVCTLKPASRAFVLIGWLSMPYLPPADLPPPPIVYTVPMTADPADLVDPPASLERDAQPRSRRRGKRQDVASTPVPQPSLAPETTRQAQFATDVSPVPAARVAPLGQPATRAEFLEATPPTSGPSTFFVAPEREPANRRSTERRSLPALSGSWVSQVRDRSDSREDEVFDALPPVEDTPTEDTPAEDIPTEDIDEEEADDAEAIETDVTESESEADEADEGEGEDEDEAAEATETAPVYPRAATPERDWSNGAVVDGVLLPPTQPTNRPPSPLDLTADYQTFEPQNQVLTARGDVVLRLGTGVLRADRLWANLANRFVIVEGGVIFTRGEQTIEADRGEYNLIQGSGTLFDARGTVFLPRLGTDFDLLGGDETTNPGVLATDPITNVQSTSSITFGTGVTVPSEATGLPVPAVGGAVRQFRFEAAQLDFDAEGWYAQDIALTNDPFSPPELEFRGDSATLTRLTDFQDELYIENARLVFDQNFSVPLFRDRVLLNRGGPDSANPLFATLAFDGEDRDGLFAERSFGVFDSGAWRVFLTPQFLVQRAIGGEETPPAEESFLSNFGLEADVVGFLSPTTGVTANASFSGLDLNNLENRLRSSVRVQQLLGSHSLNLEYSYRDRLFNGSLGFQDVQSSFGLVLISPNIPLGNTGIFVNYQASAQYINADTDRIDLLDDLTPPFRVSLGRLQGSVGISRGFLLWQGEPLPATPDEGLRFTAVPRTPNIQLVLAGRGTYTYYTSDDTQDDLSAIVGIAGEFGHFSRDFFDSTVFNLTYVRSFTSDAATSPFLFDRNVDQNRLDGGIIQQIYGPFRLGFQTAINLDTGEVINTDYVLEYNRRTYGFFLRYSPTQASGFLGFRLNEFDWAGRAPRFGGADINQVEGGVVR